ncbi:MAG TPA: HEPN domain-containing protein [Solirubrobacterales bacterium]|nr:HEPN domain-containing protein [Solirubrobacterales bacterium]
MSPRSEEFMEQARQRLADATKIIGLVHPAVVVTTAYYAMLNAARAALSERGEYAKTHAGTWTQFSAAFVAGGEFDRELSAVARRAQEARQRGDYEAAPASEAEAAEFLEGAAEFVAAVEAMLAGPSGRSGSD